MPTRYWIGVASRDHVMKGVAGGFCQLGHGKSAPVKRLAPGDGNSARALTGERPLFDLEQDRFVAARIYDRAKLLPGDRVQGPAIIDQFDATTMVLAGQAAAVDPYGILAIENDET